MVCLARGTQGVGGVTSFDRERRPRQPGPAPRVCVERPQSPLGSLCSAKEAYREDGERMRVVSFINALQIGLALWNKQLISDFTS